jgi:hypothetical protein
MRAQRVGKCPVCRNAIGRGDSISGVMYRGTWSWVHVSCKEAVLARKKKQEQESRQLKLF